ncbi:NACHT, LRR and PYD domains-containing protein 12-like isoform X1 [Ictalurus furcatus]|uniref:NACHT, LRR and PYD domains-containing protein 12-like isoform X1 n=2 Tax=Ictalurus furcatus TaxID=66913 RepID=UPI0023501168|nr:NACHT, LRR and PYD domains-containing protein 12-like isoform X1 [Ictalurus furcatus]
MRVQLLQNLSARPHLSLSLSLSLLLRNESERDFLIETGQERSSSENLQRSSIMKRHVSGQTAEPDGFTERLKGTSAAERPNSPAPSCMSMKSDASRQLVIDFSRGEKSSGKRSESERDFLIETGQERSSSENLQRSAERPNSPAPTCLSMKSDASMDFLYQFSRGKNSSGKSVEIETPHSPSPSYVFVESEKSVELNQDDGEAFLRLHPSATVSAMYPPQEPKLCLQHRMPREIYCKTDETLTCKQCATVEHRGHDKCYTQGARALLELDPLSLLEQTLNHVDTKNFMWYLCQNYPECFETPQVNCDIQEASKLILERFGSDAAPKIALKVMLELAKSHKTIQDHVRANLKDHLRFKFQSIREGNAQQGNPILLNDIFTELLITEGGGDGAVNKEHEIRQIEDACKNKGMEEIVIKCNDIFQALPGQNKRIRTVLTKGIAGIGKTVSVQKFILDWAEGNANQDIHYIFPLPFRDLNLKGNDEYSVMQLLHLYFPELKELKTLRSEEVKTVFIFDGLDECRLPLDFTNNEMCCDLTKKISVDVLLTNLIQGNILPSALLWVTSRPAAANRIPPECVDQVTEVRGFNDSEKEVYFKKRFDDQGLADKIIKHIKSSRSLHIMCHIPVFCWISATVLDKMLDESDTEVPKTLTQMYTHFLLIQTHLKNKKYHGLIQDNMDLPESDKEMIFKLAKLAFLQLKKENLIFYENDLTECDIDVSKATEYSAICTEIFKEESGLYREKVFCFVHLSIQEHLAAVYVHLQFTDSHINVLQEDTENQSDTVKMSDLHKSAVDRALKSENGHFDLFLRFLLGLSLDSNRALLRSVLPNPCLESLEETVDYIKEKIRKESSAERTINLFHCLNELHYNSLVEEIRSFLRSGTQSETELKPDQCSALAYVLLTSEEVMNEFDLKMCNTSPEGYRRLLPVVKTSRRASLAGVNLTDESCETLASILQSANSHLVELDLSFNSLGDLGVKLLCSSLSNPHSKLEKLTLSHNELEHIGVKLLCDCLMSPHCKLQTLGLAGTNFSEQSCELMASFFQSANSHLKELDLGCNNMKDSGVKLLSAGLISLQCKLEKLRLDRCDLSHESCEALKTVLQSPNSCLRQLDLSYNKLGDSGVQQLCDGLTHPNCKLELLDLSYNNLGHSGVKLLSTGLMDPDCKLKSIRLADVGIPDETCETLALALQSENPYLRELDLSNNYIGDSGVELLCAGLSSPNCFLENLSLRWCNLTEGSCSNLASVLSSHTRLTELELRDNDVQDSGLKLLCAGLQDPGCSLQKLGLSGCCVTEDGCSALVSALSSDHSQLRELDLSYNHPGESGVRQLSAVRDNPRFNLEKLSVDHCGECRIKPGLKKYACEITLDPNTAHRTLSLSGDKKVTMTKGEQPYPDHPDRFEYYAQVLCRQTLSGARFYWETEWTGNVVYIGVTYKGINRKGRSSDCKLGMNNKSWILFCSTDYGYYVSYNNKETVVPMPPNPSRRMGIYLDWQAGTLSYFIISSDRVYHTYTFHTTFTEALYPGIRVYNYDDTVTLCELE